MTGTQLVREYFPGVNDDEAGFILWNRTAFPCAPLDYLRDQLAREADLTKRFPRAPKCEECNNLALLDDLCLPCHAVMIHGPFLLTDGKP